MTPMSDKEIPELSAELALFVSDASIHCVAGLVQAVELHPVAGHIPPLGAGTVRLRVQEVISSPSLAVGDSITVAARQISDPVIRDRNGADHWNNLDIEVGRSWLLMCRFDGASRIGLAVAAVDLPKGGADIAALKTCYELERGLRARRPDTEAYLRALSSAPEVPFRYALDAIVMRQIFGREQGAVLLDRAVMASGQDPARKVDAAALALRSGLFAGRHGADAANVMVLGTLAAGAVAATDPALQTRWMRLLLAAGLGELADDAKRDKTVRLQLLRAVRVPASADVIASLERYAQRVSGAEQERVLDLVAFWRSAL